MTERAPAMSNERFDDLRHWHAMNRDTLSPRWRDVDDLLALVDELRAKVEYVQAEAADLWLIPHLQDERDELEDKVARLERQLSSIREAVNG